MLLDGKKIAEALKESIRGRVAALNSKPVLAVIQVGENAESATYIERKKKYGRDIGIDVQHISFPADIAEKALLDHVTKLSDDHSIHAIIVQLPLPKHIAVAKVMDSIIPTKDADGLSSQNVATLCRLHQWQGGSLGVDGAGLNAFVVPATARGICTLIDTYGISVQGKHVVVIGRSNLVGKPIALAMLARQATVTVCHSQSGDLVSYTKNADIIISATGHTHLINSKHVRPGQVIIDVGISHSSGRLAGDVSFDEVSPIVEAISPVPGGVGPLTVASLFQNVVDLYEVQIMRNKGAL